MEKDVDILEKIKLAMKSTYPIKEEENKWGGTEKRFTFYDFPAGNPLFQ